MGTCIETVNVTEVGIVRHFEKHTKLPEASYQLLLNMWIERARNGESDAEKDLLRLIDWFHQTGKLLPENLKRFYSGFINKPPKRGRPKKTLDEKMMLFAFVRIQMNDFHNMTLDEAIEWVAHEQGYASGYVFKRYKQMNAKLNALLRGLS